MIIIIIIKVEIYDAVDLCTIRLQLWDVLQFQGKGDHTLISACVVYTIHLHFGK